MITIFKDMYSKQPFYTTVEVALDRIKKGNSKDKCEEIRATLDKEKAQKLKQSLPPVCFSGKFSVNRKDEDLIEHSGFIILDFDKLDNLREKQTEIINYDFIHACWVSPSGNGLKALVRIAEPKKHKEHFESLREIFPELDKSGCNVSRLCFESYDPDIYHYPDSEIYTKYKVVERVIERVNNSSDDYTTFQKLLKWLSNKNEAFITGERNNFIFKLACACCKFGIIESSCCDMITSEFLINSQFSESECSRTIKSAYRANSAIFGSATFEKEILVDRITRKEIKLDKENFEDNTNPKDVIYGIDVKDKALDIYDNGYSRVDGIGVMELDFHFKPKRGEITLLTGIGNYGKSSFKKWYQCMRILLFDEKFASFSPEDNPPEEYYHDYVEILLGCDCTPQNRNRPSKKTYEYVYDWISKHIFYIYPKEVEPTPKYIMEVFLALIIKEKIDGVDIDPFNQMSNNYQGFPGRDKYLEWVLSLFGRFAQINDVYFWIIAHPKSMSKGGDGNYECPDVFDINDGAMWNNKMDNILVYHRPFAQSDPINPACEFHSKKIRRQKTVGKRGGFLFAMKFEIRRFIFNDIDPLKVQLQKKELNFNDIPEPVIYENRLPYKNDYIENLGEELPF